MIDFVLGPLVEHPPRVGKPLRGDLAGLHAARIGAYRVVCEIDATGSAIGVPNIAHRAGIYRPGPSTFRDVASGT